MPRGVLKHNGYRVLVTGGRSYNNWASVYSQLDKVHALRNVPCIIVGRCPSGLDVMAECWAVERGIPVMPFPVTRGEWKTLGGCAGPLRNQRMVDEGCPDVAMAWPGRRGTADCTERCKEKGIIVWEIEDPPIPGAPVSEARRVFERAVAS